MPQVLVRRVVLRTALLAAQRPAFKSNKWCLGAASLAAATTSYGRSRIEIIDTAKEREIMRRRLPRIVVVGLLLIVAAVAANAQPTVAIDKLPGSPPKSSFSTDESDLWWNPNESGWGMQLVQQGSIIFATLFIYAADGTPTWATAALNSIGNLTWSGALFVTNGPWFGGPFNPAEVGARQVGTLTFSAPLVDSGTVTYSIDGVVVTKQVQRQLFNLDDYNGAYVVTVNLTQSSCFNPAINGSGTGAFAIAINQQGSSMAMTWVFPNGQTCIYTGSYSQAGRMGSFQGTYSCNNGEIGSMTFFEMTNRIGMLSGRLDGQSSNVGCRYTGRFTGLDPNKP